MITLNLELDEVNVVLNALGELPAKVSMPVIQKVQEQAHPQVAPAEEKNDKNNNISALILTTHYSNLR